MAETSSQIMSGYRRRFRLQYRTGYKEIKVDLSGLFGHVSSNIHSKSQWMSMANPVAVLKRLIPGLF
jgi:hypothetical protein